MLNQTFVLEVLVNDHRNDLLKEANADWAFRQVKKKGSVQANQIKCIVARLAGLLIGPVRQVVDRRSFFTDEKITAGHR